MPRDAGKEDYLGTIGIRLLRIPNGVVLEDPEGFVRRVQKHMGIG
jgi:very-short-patch-repair endonuclease